MLNTEDLTRTSALLEALEHEEARVRLLAAETISLFRPADDVIPHALRGVADHDADPQVRQAATDALKKYR